MHAISKTTAEKVVVFVRKGAAVKAVIIFWIVDVLLAISYFLLYNWHSIHNLIKRFRKGI